ncbi:MAG TPA: DNA cytosine methyltransferase [Candidatus Hydrogenedentes bacterium]|nr:DNA cytosine methyltransferase [Candidatus Hydrogenedentota bacterium]HOC71286.1 DNA cytosine methyltransferase [Candidatus Hydrogenedentota bacterium]HOH52365.1 DNA cytosine methyltransferase [Candidatus Hydrogenedentota bacterium]
MSGWSSIEICAGAGGQALGLEQAGFEHVRLVEIDADACQTLRINRPVWTVAGGDVRQFDATAFRGLDLLAGGVPCPPFSVAGRQLGPDDERDLFPEALRLVEESRPRAVLLENVRGILDARFADYRAGILDTLRKLGYAGGWKLLNASDYGVPQLRPRAILVAVRSELSECFAWPERFPCPPPTVGECLYDLMAGRGWRDADVWREQAASVAPTLVGGSKKHGGPDLGPTRAKRQWAALGVDGNGIADEAPSPEFTGMPRLTTRMAARLQGFPDSWLFYGRKTAAYRQIGNAFPPPMAAAVGMRIAECLRAAAGKKVRIA